MDNNEESESSSIEVSLTAVDVNRNRIFEVERGGKLCKAIRIVGRVLRFINNVKSHKSQRSWDA